jgi:hypothetical protein
MRAIPPIKPPALRTHRLQWVLEPIANHPSFFQRPMFGCVATYLFGKLMLVLAAKEEPWDGILICTSREFHGPLTIEYSDLQPHPVLGKWLYLPRGHNNFEEIARHVLLQIAKNDPRIGVEPGVKGRKRLR